MLNFWEAYGEGQIPQLLPLRGINPCHVSSSRCAVKGVSAEERWAGLAPALAIVDQVSPPVAAWVRQRWQTHTLVFSDRFSGTTQHRGSVAAYDHFRGRLTIDRAVFYENDGTVAAILCHEFRHSRQSSAKVFRYALSFLSKPDGDPSIIENDAELFEHDTRVAIFGH
jgi:hypothetical protein